MMMYYRTMKVGDHNSKFCYIHQATIATTIIPPHALRITQEPDEESYIS